MTKNHKNGRYELAVRRLVENRVDKSKRIINDEKKFKWTVPDWWDYHWIDSRCEQERLERLKKHGRLIMI